MKSAAAAYDHRYEGTETTVFTIDPSGKAFRTLIDKLYSNKVESIVRELSTNAWDAHVVHGNVDQPFNLHAPNALKPFFAVRDYGVGMDHETVTNVFTTLFKSTKDKSNDAAGLFGLGAKSPWSICSMFTVQCFDGRTRRDYAAAIGPDGRPVLHFAGETVSDEPRGVRVEVPVREGQFDEFAKAIEKVSAGFDVPPTCNIPSLIQPLPDATLQGDGWRYWEKFTIQKNQTWFVRMGCVIYPLSPTGGLHLP